jgi:hypothetical protein
MARTVVDHYALNANTELGIVERQRPGKKQRRFPCGGLPYLHESDAQASSIQTWTNPTDAMIAIDCAGIASGDALSHGTDASELFDIDVDQFARTFPLIATHRCGRLKPRAC